MYKIEEAPRELSFGRQGETGVIEYEFDYTAWAALWPGGTPSVTVILPYSEGVVALDDAEQVSAAENILTIKVLTNLTTTPGRGTMVIAYKAAGIEKRTPTIDFVVEKGHGAVPAAEP